MDVPTPRSKQPMMESILVSSVLYAKSSPQHKQLLNATIEFICYGLNPVSIVDNPSFQNLLAVADRKYTIPTHTHFSRKLIPEKYIEVQAQVQREMESTKNLSITTDLWTSQH